MSVIDVFNVTNAQPALYRDQLYNQNAAQPVTPPYTTPTNPTYGMDMSWQAPRLIRLGMKVVF